MRPHMTATAAALALLAAPAAAEPPRVVASIKPIHALVAAVMEGVGEPELLLSGADSPHGYALRPSDARTLDGADLVFHVGPSLETFLERPLRVLAEGAAVELLAAEGLELLPVRAGGTWEAHGHEGEGEHAPEHEGEHEDEDGGIDPHVWLDPDNAAAIVRAVAAELAVRDPANVAAYGANAERTAAALAELKRDLAARLAPLRGAPFVVFHDAYHYFEHAFGVEAAGAIALDPDRAPGARRVGEIRDRLRELGAACVFAEPQFEPRLVATIVEGTGARAGTLDPLGAALDPGPGLYPELLRRLADDLAACLAPA